MLRTQLQVFVVCNNIPIYSARPVFSATHHLQLSACVQPLLPVAFAPLTLLSARGQPLLLFAFAPLTLLPVSGQPLLPVAFAPLTFR